MQIFQDIVYYLSYHITLALIAPIKSDSFIFWPFILSTIFFALLASLYWKKKQTRLNPKTLKKQFLSTELWWHPSARVDYKLYFVNALLLPVFFGIVLLSQNDLVNWIDRILGYDPKGSINLIESFGWRLAFTVIFFIAYDFGRFVAHSLLHDVPVLWQFHKVHHSAAVLTPMTAFRAHPLDLLIMAWGGVIMSGFIAWCFNHLSGGRVDAYMFMGLNILFWVSNLMGNLRHTHVWLTYGPVIGKWLISPAHHQLHHSSEERHLGCNRGFDIALWDRLYGTLYVPSGPEEDFSIGIKESPTEKWQTLGQMLTSPFVEIIKMAIPKKYLSSKS